MALQPHQQRVIQEQNDLLEKRGKLGEFFDTAAYHALPLEETRLLNKQAAIMDEYSNVLAQRIAIFWREKIQDEHQRSAA